jgi:acetylornithine deacetylase/succinyl-diaminopimelate desuccinylase-like protein
VAELRQIVAQEVEIELVRHDLGPAEPDMGLFDMLAGVLQEADPEGIPVPLLLTGTTDACYFSRLGIQTYGFTPMNLPADLNFIQAVHAINERIPVEAMVFGTEAIYQALRRCGK